MKNTRVNFKTNILGMPAPPDDNSFMWNMLLYALSALLGLLAKLGTLYAANKLVLGEAVKEVTITCLAVWIVYNFCAIYNLSPNWMFLCGAISARFGDQVILLTWGAIKNIINKLP